MRTLQRDKILILKWYFWKAIIINLINSSFFPPSLIPGNYWLRMHCWPLITALWNCAPKTKLSQHCVRWGMIEVISPASISSNSVAWISMDSFHLVKGEASGASVYYNVFMSTLRVELCVLWSSSASSLFIFIYIFKNLPTRVHKTRETEFICKKKKMW